MRAFATILKNPQSSRSPSSSSPYRTWQQQYAKSFAVFRFLHSLKRPVNPQRLFLKLDAMLFPETSLFISVLLCGYKHTAKITFIPYYDPLLQNTYQPK